MTGSLAVTLLAALGSALVLGALAHRLGMAPMIGYIAAGLVVGPFTPGLVANPDEVLALADIGVALLMFSIGLRFRLGELLEVGRLVLFGAPLQVAFSMGLDGTEPEPDLEDPRLRTPILLWEGALVVWKLLLGALLWSLWRSAARASGATASAA